MFPYYNVYPKEIIFRLAVNQRLFIPIYNGCWLYAR